MFEGIQISGRAFKLISVDGVELFPTESKFNLFIVIIDPMKKFVTVIRNSHKPYW